MTAECAALLWHIRRWRWSMHWSRIITTTYDRCCCCGETLCANSGKVLKR